LTIVSNFSVFKEFHIKIFSIFTVQNQKKMNGIVQNFIAPNLGKVWLITDTHWNHKSIIKYENRPENHGELICENWKDMVEEKDVVIHLGDVIFAKQGTLNEILAPLPGRKILIKGNHDRNSAWYLTKGFDEVHKHYLIICDEILLSHKPMDIEAIEAELGIKIRYNIHGHFHSKVREISPDSPPEDTEGRRAEDYAFYSKRHLRLSIEEENYKPVELNDYLKRFEK